MGMQAGKQGARCAQRLGGLAGTARVTAGVRRAQRCPEALHPCPCCSARVGVRKVLRREFGELLRKHVELAVAYRARYTHAQQDQLKTRLSSRRSHLLACTRWPACQLCAEMLVALTAPWLRFDRRVLCPSTCPPLPAGTSSTRRVSRSAPRRRRRHGSSSSKVRRQRCCS